MNKGDGGSEEAAYDGGPGDSPADVDLEDAQGYRWSQGGVSRSTSFPAPALPASRRQRAPRVLDTKAVAGADVSRVHAGERGWPEVHARHVR